MATPSLEYLNPKELEKYLEKQWGKCTRCPLSETRIGKPVFGKGDLSRAGILFIGEAPGGQEELQNEVFVGRTGNLLYNILWMLDIEDGQHRFTNTVMCRPPDLDNPKKNREPMSNEINACRERLYEEIYYYNPKLIVALGAIATKVLGGTQCGLSLRGEFVDIQIPSRVKGTLTYPMLITWHPAWVLRKIDYRIGDKLPVIDNFAKIFFSDNAYEQLVRDLALAQGTYEYIQAAYQGKTEIPEIVSDLAIMLN